MIARVEKPYTREEYKNLSSDERKNAQDELIQLYIEKYIDVKQPHLLRTARRLCRRKLMSMARDLGVGSSRGVRHYEKGDYWRYCEAMAELIKEYLGILQKMCITSREHGYSFNPYSVNFLRFIDMYVQYLIPVDVEYGSDGDEEKPELKADIMGDFGTLFDNVDNN